LDFFAATSSSKGVGDNVGVIGMSSSLIMQEAHDSPYSIHPGNTKMYMDLKGRFSWSNMKRNVAEYIALCDVCNRVKAEH
jgi:hypothetical protein